ncbi:MAG: NUDIX hydrolase [Candidatus Babeliales bacterium]
MLVAKVLVFYNVGEQPLLLLLKRTSKALVSPGMEDLPGGTIESGESVADGAVREVQEEAGLTLKRMQQLTTHEWPHPSGKMVLEYLFCAVVDTKDVTISPREHDSFRWIKLDELEHSALHPNIKKIIHLQQHHIEELLKSHNESKSIVL